MDSRILKLREYLFNVINTLTTNRNYQINANMLSDKIDDYSLDKIPTNQVEKPWIIGTGTYKDIYSFRGRKTFSTNAQINLDTMNFFEQFEDLIENNNRNKILPSIDGIEKIECLNPGTMRLNNDGKSAEFDIQIQITYRKIKKNIISL
ncbi:MAG: hypothetical protein VZR33_05615 [Methanosphaera sp.]|nr:hypothetical protein [Methanosphaera sp.]